MNQRNSARFWSAETQKAASHSTHEQFLTLSEESHFHFQVCFLAAAFYCLYIACSYANVIIFQRNPWTQFGNESSYTSCRELQYLGINFIFPRFSAVLKECIFMSGRLLCHRSQLRINLKPEHYILSSKKINI